MRSKFIHLTISIVVFVGLSLVLVFLTSSSHSEPVVAGTEENAHEHGEAELAHGAESL